MRVTTSLLACLVAGACSSTAPMQSNEPVEGCSVTDCFNRHQVRDYEIIDDTTMVIYTGTQRCPFLVEFDGMFCDLTFMPGGDIAFVARGIRQMEMRICSRDRHIGIDEGPFSTASGGDAVPAGRLPCQILDVASLTDDELIELYVDNGVTAPPPPFGTGEISVGESDDEDQGTSTPAEEGTDAAPAERPTAANAP